MSAADHCDWCPFAGCDCEHQWQPPPDEPALFPYPNPNVRITP